MAEQTGTTESNEVPVASSLDSRPRERERAQRLQEQKQSSRAEFAATELPNLLSSITNQGQNQEDGSAINDDQRAKIIDALRRRYQSNYPADRDGQKSSKNRTGLNTLRQAQRDLKQLLRGRQIGLFGLIMFTIMGSIAGFLDILPIVTGDLASILDWILDAGFFFMLFITMVVVTGDLMRSIFGFRGILNLAQTILEFIPVSDIIPWHTVAVLVLYLDVKYGIVKIAKKFIPGNPASASKPSLGGSTTSG